MGHLKDVFCWSEGSRRELVIRARKDKVCIPLRKDKEKDSPGAREILRMMIPEGLYVMNGGDGGCFQKEYTHEFPEVHPAIFKKLQSAFLDKVEEHPDYPREQITSDNGASRLHLFQADWIACHAEEAKNILDSKTEKKQKLIHFQ